MSIQWEDGNRRLALEGRDILERTSQSLINSQRVAVETEEIGSNVVSELHQQRETLLRSKRRLEETDDNLATTRSLLRKMTCHVITNKLILILLILLEALILTAVVYLRFFKK